MPHSPTVLAIGGLDPSGGAGLFVDQRAVAATDCLFAGVCSTITIQDGVQFFNATPQPAADVVNAIEQMFSARKIACVKTGALGSAEIPRAFLRVIKNHPDVPLVVDPVLKSTTRGDLFSQEAQLLLKTQLLPLATLITPNLQEASYLCDMPVETVDQMALAADKLVKMGARFALVKGGHLSDGNVVDILASQTALPRRFSSQRLPTGEIRGTGCALASLSAAYIALGEPIEKAVERARKQLFQALKDAKDPGFGPKILHFR